MHNMDTLTSGEPAKLGLPGDGMPPDDSFLRFVQIWNELQGYATPALHHTIVDWLERGSRRPDGRLLLMVFRNAGKSTLVGLYAAWRLRCDPNLRILVISADHALACKMTRNVRRIIERHPSMMDLKPKRKEMWAADQLTVERPMSLRDPSLLARGISSNITGSRADLVICDDVEVPNTADTPAKREELRERLNEIPFVLVPGGAQLFVGTPHTYQSIYADQQTMEATETQPVYLAAFDRLVLPIYGEDGESRWPERFSSDHIESILQRSGPAAFQSQMLLRPNAGHQVRLDPDRLRFYDLELKQTGSNGVQLLLLGERRLVASACFWDPAYGRDERADASVVAVVFLDQEGEYWLHGIRYLRVQEDLTAREDAASQQCRAVVRFLKQMYQSQIIVENNGIGQFLPSMLRRVLNEERTTAAVLSRSSTSRKADRILNAFDPLLAAGRLHAHRSVWNTPFIAEMREWSPIGQCRDDGLDAVSSCLRHLPPRGAMPPLSHQADPPSSWQATARIYRAKANFNI